MAILCWILSWGLVTRIFRVLRLVCDFYFENMRGIFWKEIFSRPSETSSKLSMQFLDLLETLGLFGRIFFQESVVWE